MTQAAPWDLTALINAADPQAALAERHLWPVRLTEWRRHAPAATLAAQPGTIPHANASDAASTPLPVERCAICCNCWNAMTTCASACGPWCRPSGAMSTRWPQAKR